MALRGYVTTWGNSCWGIGQLLAVAVIKSMFKRDDQWAYRIPYGLQVSRFPALLAVTGNLMVFLDVVSATYRWHISGSRVALVVG